VYFFAFKRQYPKWLFPGKSDRDHSAKPIKADGIDYILDSLNPVTWIKVFQKIKAVNPDLVIIPWWVSFWAPQFWTIAVLTKSLTNSKILFLCHNVVEHESKNIHRQCTKLVLKNGNYFIVHSNEEFKNLKQMIPGAHIKQTHHPIYEVFNFESFPKDKARQTLGIKGRTILFFGFVRPYKGLKYLLAAMPKIPEQWDINLLIVGEFWNGEEVYRKRIKELGIENKTIIINKYVPNEEVGLYFAAADVVILPYISATGSGIVQLAFGCNRPVISTRVGCLPEVIDHERTGYLVPARDSQALADAVVSFYRKNKEAEFTQNIEKEKPRFSWEKMLETIESFL